MSSRYLEKNYCKGCELWYSKELGRYCPDCGQRSRSNPRGKKWKIEHIRL